MSLCIQPSYSGGQRGDRRQDQRSKAVTYPLGHLGQQGSSRYDYDRDDRDVGYSRDRNRSNNRNRSGGMRGGLNINEGPGILGAKPGAQPPSLTSDLSSPLQGLLIQSVIDLNSDISILIFFLVLSKSLCFIFFWSSIIHLCLFELMLNYTLSVTSSFYLSSNDLHHVPNLFPSTFFSTFHV